MVKKGLFALLLSLILVTTASGKVQVLKLKDGREIRGEITKTDGAYRVTMTFGGVVTFAAEDVDSVRDIVSPEEQYKEELKKIDPKDPEAHFRLARWAEKANLLRIAKKELETALKLKPDYEAAALLLKQINEKLKNSGDGGPSPEEQYRERLEKIDPKDPEAHFQLARWAERADLLTIAKKELETALKLKPDYESAALLLKQVEEKLKKRGDNGDEVKPPLTKVPLVEDEDIYRIRLEELRKGDVVSVQFRNDVVERFISAMAGRGAFKTPDADRQFRRLSNVSKALYMLDQRPDDVAMKDDILVKSDPGFMKDFRAQAWPIVRNFCATTNCHGGGTPKGGLIFFNVGAGNERADYTNFVILDGVMVRGRRLIDRNNPEESLLLNFTLPEEQARYKHPRKISPAFRQGRSSANYKRVLKWILSLDGNPRLDYRLKYKPPFGIKLHGKRTMALPEPTTSPGTTSKPAREEDLPNDRPEVP